MPAVTLDLWHTLVAVPPDVEEAYMSDQVALAGRALARAPVRPGGPELPEEELAAAFAQVYAEAVREAGEGRTVTPVEQLRRAADRTGRSPEVGSYLEGLRELVDRLPLGLAPGALEFLRRLDDGGYRLAVISNTVGEPGAYLRPALTRLGLDRFIPVYVFSDELPWTKPSPRIFRSALERLSTDPGTAIHVGDGWNDILGAQRAGYRAEILFTGFNDYAERYRALFAPRDIAWPTPKLTAESFDAAARMIETELPVPRAQG